LTTGPVLTGGSICIWACAEPESIAGAQIADAARQALIQRREKRGAGRESIIGRLLVEWRDSYPDLCRARHRPNG
jgi:hypothetical protein